MQRTVETRERGWGRPAEATSAPHLLCVGLPGGGMSASSAGLGPLPAFVPPAHLALTKSPSSNGAVAPGLLDLRLQFAVSSYPTPSPAPSPCCSPTMPRPVVLLRGFQWPQLPRHQQRDRRGDLLFAQRGPLRWERRSISPGQTGRAEFHQRRAIGPARYTGLMKSGPPRTDRLVAEAGTAQHSLGRFCRLLDRVICSSVSQPPSPSYLPPPYQGCPP